MVNNINPAEHRFDSALHNLASLATTPAQLRAVDAVLLAREGLFSSHVVQTLGEVAAFFGVQEQTCRTWRLRAAPMPGEPGEWNLSEIALWRIAAEQSKHRPRNEDAALLDLIGEPGGEDWKDRWVRAKALLSEGQLAEVQGNLVDLEEIAPLLRRAGSLIGDGIRRLEAEYGQAAGDIMRTPLERFAEAVEAMVDRSEN